MIVSQVFNMFKTASEYNPGQKGSVLSEHYVGTVSVLHAFQWKSRKPVVNPCWSSIPPLYVHTLDMKANLLYIILLLSLLILHSSCFSTWCLSNTPVPGLLLV